VKGVKIVKLSGSTMPSVELESLQCYLKIDGKDLVWYLGHIPQDVDRIAQEETASSESRYYVIVKFR
jgi:hypothetical protein